jgi:hypothetical protein
MRDSDRRCESILVRKKRASDRGDIIAEDHEIEHLQEIAAGDPNDVHDLGPRRPGTGRPASPRQYAGHLYLFDSYDEEQSHAGSLDVCSRFGGIGRCVVGGRKGGCAEFDSGRSVDLGADRLLY